MSRPNRDKLPTQGQAPGLFQAFAGLDLGGLPTGPEDPVDTTEQAPPCKKGRVVLRRETAHRGGKTVIIIDGFAPHIDPQAIEALGKKLRTACGTGGSVKGRTVEIQGEPIARLRELLAAEGFQVAGEH